MDETFQYNSYGFKKFYSGENINLSRSCMDEMLTVPQQGEISTNEKTDSYFVLDACASFTLHKTSVFLPTLPT